MEIDIIEDGFEGINYKYFKNPHKKHTLLFLHGFMGNSSIWGEYIEVLKDKYNLILIDLIGHGKSYVPKKIREYSFQNQSVKMLKLINKLKINSISIVCYSYSAYIGLFILNSIPNKVKTAVFISPYFKKKPSFIERWAFKFINFIWKYLVPNKKFNLDYSKIKNYEEPTFSDKKYILKCINTKDLLGSYYSFNNLENTPKFYICHTPILIIYGKKDKTLSKRIKNNFKKCVHIKFKIFNKKHLFLKTKSKETVKFIKLFFAKHLQK